MSKGLFHHGLLVHFVIDICRPQLRVLIRHEPCEITLQ